MPVQITIRNVPGWVRDMLKSKAASRGQSMQAFLLGELEQIAAVQNNKEVMQEVKERLAASGNQVSIEDILRARDADRM